MLEVDSYGCPIAVANTPDRAYVFCRFARKRPGQATILAWWVEVKLKKFPWTTVIPAVADAARELFGRRSEEGLSAAGPRAEMESQISEITQRLQSLEAFRVDQALIMKNLGRIKTGSSVAIGLSIAAFVISCITLFLLLIR